MHKLELNLPYPRPKSLSDPGYDFTADHLATLLATPDTELKWHDFQCLLGPFLPAGTYEESAYFLPLAFEYILTHDENELDLTTSLVWFASEFAPQLERDGALEAVRAKLQLCLDHWTNSFTIHHLDREVCVKKGFNRKYMDGVHHKETLMTTVNDLIRFQVHRDLSFKFFADLAAAESAPIKSAWFLECARASAAKDIRRPPKHPAIQELLDNEALRSKHTVIVRESFVDFDPQATYWLDTFTLLGTIDYSNCKRLFLHWCINSLIFRAPGRVLGLRSNRTMSASHNWLRSCC